MTQLSSFLLVSFCFFALGVSAQSEYYKSLGISPESTEADIKSAYRRLSVKYHPDKNPGNEEAALKYLEITKAYEVLANSELRQVYDMYGEEGLKEYEQQKNDPWGSGKKKGPNYKVELKISMEELYSGVVKEMSITKNVLCKSCKGTGAKDGKLKECKYCGGKGVRLQNVNMGIGFQVQMQVACERCGGKGQSITAPCPSCNSRKVLPETKVFKVQVEKGMANGQTIVFPRESEQHPDYIPGDLVFTIVQGSHPMFQRIGDNLYHNMKLSLKDSILGFKRQIKHLDDHYVEIASNEVVQPFSVRVIKGEGMPKHPFASEFGALHVKQVVSLPKKLTEEQRRLVREIFSKSK